jgi:hypothetical protein
MPDWLAERVGFHALNVEPCTALYQLVQGAETKYLLEFQSPLDFVEVFWRLIQIRNVAKNVAGTTSRSFC